MTKSQPDGRVQSAIGESALGLVLSPLAVELDERDENEDSDERVD